MPPINRDPATVVDIFLACEDILAFTRGMSYSDFRRDSRTQAAVAYKLTIIGEATRRFSPQFKTEHGEVPWREIADTRNVLVHQYDEVELMEVWEMVSQDVPRLLDYIRPLLPNEHE